jgi:hypothetical protein
VIAVARTPADLDAVQQRLQRWGPAVGALSALTALLFVSRLAYLLNADAGGWLLFFGILLVLLSLVPTRWSPGRLMLHGGVALSLGLILWQVDRQAAWQASCVIQTSNGPVDIGTGARYLRPTHAPSQLQVHAVNDHWEISGQPADAAVEVTWTKGNERLVTTCTHEDVFALRDTAWWAPEPAARFPLILTTALLLIALTDRLRGLPFTTFRGADFLRSFRSWPLVMALGLVFAAFMHPPHQWLSNTFLSRGDDWLHYERAARAMVMGDLSLMPMPGGTELWGLGYVPFVALLHGLLGPALWPVLAVQTALLTLLVPGICALVRNDRPGLNRVVAFGAAIFTFGDVVLPYGWALLSDTVPLVLLVALVVMARRGYAPTVLGLGSGLLFLLRAELIAIGPLLLLTTVRGRPIDQRTILRFLLPFVASLVIYAARKFGLHGDLIPVPVALTNTGPTFWDRLIDRDELTHKFLLLLGRYDLFDPDFRVRWHWWPLHALFVIAMARAVLHHFLDRWVVFGSLAWAYVLLTRLISPSVGIYGHRHSLMLIVLEIMVVVLSTERWLDQRTAADQQAAAQNAGAGLI